MFHIDVLAKFAAIMIFVFSILFVAYLEVYARMTKESLRWHDSVRKTFVPSMAALIVIFSWAVLTGCGLYYLILKIAVF